MMPPETGFKPTASPGRVVPYPNQSLRLGADVWLHQTGEVSSTRPISECELTAETLSYWEETALRGQGVPLSDLIV